MEKQKRNIEFIANNTGEAMEMKKSLEKRGFMVTHIYTGSSVPTLIDNGDYTTGAGKIRMMYGLK
jgi:hypothetical protein